MFIFYVIFIFSELEEKMAKLQEEIKRLKGERKDTVLRQKSQELSDKIEILVLENKRLKEIIREKDEATDDNMSDTSSVKSDINCSCGNKTGSDVHPDKNSNLPVFKQSLQQIAYV